MKRKSKRKHSTSELSIGPVLDIDTGMNLSTGGWLAVRDGHVAGFSFSLLNVHYPSVDNECN